MKNIDFLQLINNIPVKFDLFSSLNSLFKKIIFKIILNNIQKHAIMKLKL